MKKHLKTKKILSTGLALGILTGGATFIAPTQQTFADASTTGSVIKSAGDIYNAFLRTPFDNWLSEIDARNTYSSENENLAYRAPTFKQGEFSVSYYDFYKNPNSVKKIITVSPNGSVNYHTLKHGEQLTITQADTAILYIDRRYPEFTNGIAFFYVDADVLRNGNLGIAASNFQTYYLKQTNRLQINFTILSRYYPSVNPLHLANNDEAYFNRLSLEQQSRAKITGDLIDWNELIGSTLSLTESQLVRIRDLQENPATKTFLENK
ncbi:TPA: hypothetical protein QCS32_006167 [Bacillus thuringiensis]|uniref:Uncharacterized protein n=1 Tax=Bacillus thuringiensis serovar iberica TaxID=180866 RepID=A0A9X6LQ72_BACTU|nr:hypothetical protein [Bacillus thuringiensis]MEB9625990.1 hypothetical protein [Bacillus cereus]OUB50333.1 hypothetical protein BK741_10315 [Bacillus thuringiensis serovar iberica]HDR5354343.1 hypothetical protein [Bacillus thuringiensis]